MNNDDNPQGTVFVVTYRVEYLNMGVWSAVSRGLTNPDKAMADLGSDIRGYRLVNEITGEVVE